MSPDGNAASSASSPAAAGSAGSPSVKRGRDPEDEVYVDNLHSHKRYLSEIMASSLNGLSVGDSLSENLMDSHARTESSFYPRDESFQYSPMSEDSDDSRYYENPMNTCSSQPESVPTSPVSPYRSYKLPNGYASGHPSTSYPSHSCVVSSVAPQTRQRASDTEGRFPSSPSDICHSADLRRAALLRSVQMRTQPLGSSQFELPFTPGQEPAQNMETEEPPCSCMKAIVDERVYEIAETECSSLSVSEHDNGDEFSGTSVINLKGDKSAAE